MPTISQVETISYNRRHVFSSEAGPNYYNIATWSFNCFVEDVLNDDGILSGISALIILKETADYQPWTVAGQLLTRCKVENFELQEGDLVIIAKATVTLSIIEEGQDRLKLGDEYEAELSSFYDFFSSISESINVSRGPNNANYTRTISATLNRSRGLGGTSESYTDLAKSTLKKILDKNIAGGYNYDIYEADPDLTKVWTDSSYYKIRKEVHDTINNTVTISESLETSNIKDDQIAHSYNISIEISEDGIATISEKGKVDSLYFADNNRIEKARLQLTSIETDAKTRATDAYELWCSFTDIPLIQDGGAPMIVKKFYVVNEAEGSIEYTFLFTNDSNADGHQYSLEISKENCNTTALEKGTFFDIRLDGDLTPKKRYERAYALYKAAISSIDTRIKTYVTCSMTSPFQKSETHDVINGSLSYFRAFTDNPIYDNGLTIDGTRVKKLEIKKSSVLPTFHSVSANILGVGEIEQVSINTKESSDTMSISMLLDRIQHGELQYTKVAGCITTAKDKIDDSISGDNLDKLLSVKYQWAPLNDVTFSIDADFSSSQECE